MDNDATQQHSPTEDENSHSATFTVKTYLLTKSDEFRVLSELRRLGWASPSADKHFRKQRERADNCGAKEAKTFFNMMKNIGQELQMATAAFTITPDETVTAPAILDMCMAPGGFLYTAIQTNPRARTMAFSLPVDNGGHRVLLPKTYRVTPRLLDITMLLADMTDTGGIQEVGGDGGGRRSSGLAVPLDHPDYGNFILERQIPDGMLFDLVLCDGHVLRTHSRAEYREPREAVRLTSTQLALGLEHLRPGGTLILLLHQLDQWRSVKLVHLFTQFSTVHLFKPTIAHNARSSFYMVASQVQSRHPEAVKAVARWKTLWRSATFNMDEVWREDLEEPKLSVEQVLEEFGPELVSMGRDVWRIQAEGLAKAPYIRKAQRARDRAGKRAPRNLAANLQLTIGETC